MELWHCTWGDVDCLKAAIVDVWDTYDEDLVACVLIGSLPCAFYEFKDDYFDEDHQFGYRHFPCDLFLCDLGGLTSTHTSRIMKQETYYSARDLGEGGESR